MPQRVWTPADDPGEPSVITEDRAQPGRGQRLAPAEPLGHQEQPVVGRFGPLGQQIHLDHRSDVDVQRDPPFPLSLAEDPQPPAADVDIRDVQAQHLG